MATFHFLSKNVQKKVWDMGWDRFTAIQDKAIPSILHTNKDIILSSGTASGKTEAAFLPILSLVENEATENFKVLYISPMKALINNQFERIFDLCESMEISIHKWHGDVSQSKKKKFIENPNGILQITPESIESLFINRTEQLHSMMKHLDFIIIDEIHSFLNADRGVHLRSLLHRLEEYTESTPRIIGLSATIDNFQLIKQWVNHSNVENVEIIQSPGSDKTLLYSLMHFPPVEPKGDTSYGTHTKPLELFEDLRALSRDQKALIFCNSRGEVEETTVLLNRLAKKEGLEQTYFAHHSSIDKKEREYVEKVMSETLYPKSIVATSSLELGIDIGSIDIVVQLDSTFTVTSLKQRLGRSGRKRDAEQLLQLYTTEKNQLLQSLAVMELVIENWVEPAQGYPLPYDILLHQVISICKETNGMTMDMLIKKIDFIGIFNDLKLDDIKHMIGYMVDNEHLEQIHGTNELIVGLEGERLMRGKEFYAVFQTSEDYKVVTSKKHIGTLGKDMLLTEGDNFILTGKLWKIIEVDTKNDTVFVKKATDGKPPKYGSGEIKIHKRIAEKAWEILCSNGSYNYLNNEGKYSLEDLRRAYHYHEITMLERIIWKDKDRMNFETFAGSTITKNIIWMFRSQGLDIIETDGVYNIIMKYDSEILQKIEDIKNTNWKASDLIKVAQEAEFFNSKFSPYLPESLQKEIHSGHKIDIENTLEFLEQYNFRVI